MTLQPALVIVSAGQRRRPGGRCRDSQEREKTDLASSMCLRISVLCTTSSLLSTSALPGILRPCTKLCLLSVATIVLICITLPFILLQAAQKVKVPDAPTTHEAAVALFKNHSWSSQNRFLHHASVSFCWCIHMASSQERGPLGPYATVCADLFILFLWALGLRALA